MQKQSSRRERIEKLKAIAQQDKNTVKVFQACYLLRELTRREFLKQQSC